MNTPDSAERLRAEQYADSSNLEARINLHERFGSDKYGWYSWIFDHFQFPDQGRILELGCGVCGLWLKNAHRVPHGWRITLSDFSPGMLADGRRALGGSAERFRFVVADARGIPFPDESFDGVIANHMLYHVPNPDGALAEIHRVLRPDGKLYATTVGRSHMAELPELIGRFDPAIDGWSRVTDRFDWENGRAQLSRLFSDVEFHRHEDSLVVTDAGPLVATSCPHRVTRSGG